MENLTGKTLGYLRAAGWTDDRRIDTDAIENTLERAGYLVHKSALDFLEQFGGLHIVYPHAKVSNMEDEMHFDPLVASRHTQPGRIAAYGRFLKAQLCLLGEAARGYLVLLMDEDGRVYAAYDDYFALVSKSGVGAIEAFCESKKLQDIQLPDGWSLP